MIPTGFESERVPGSIMMRGMVIDMNDGQLNTLVQLQAFLDGTREKKGDAHLFSYLS